ncbi:MAG: hypothetical protein FWD89_02305 [Firmicutes bacterium]|nr:hypothetical protein [Bacillota bacterium]MCL2771123.1 hypothetical protein [Bacillota bacterium]
MAKLGVTKDFLYNISGPRNSQHFLAAKNYFESLLKTVVATIAEKRELDVKDFKIYLQGPYETGINIDAERNLEIVVELLKDQEENIKEVGLYKPKALTVAKDAFTRAGKRNQVYQSIYSLEDFKNEIANELMEETNNNQMFLEPKSITFPKTKHSFLAAEILPAFSFAKLESTSEEDIYSLLIFDAVSKKHVLAYPKLHDKNISDKDRETAGYFKRLLRATRILRTLMIQNNILVPGEAPAYFVDCLMYNLPKEIWNTKPNASEAENLYFIYKKALNYLKNCNLSLFMCAHEQYRLFVRTSDGWDITKARKFILLLIYLWQNLNLDI